MSRNALILVVCLGSFSSNAQAQNELDRSRLNTAAFYNYSEPGDVTIQVHVWGALRFPGLYEIPAETKMSKLFSLAGGPQLGMRGQYSKITLNVKLLRSSGAFQTLVYQATMENQIMVTEDDPELRAGDVLSVEGVVRQRLSWRDIFPVISAVASVSTAIYYFTITN